MAVELIRVQHPRTGTRYDVPKRQVDAAKQAGFEVVGAEVNVPEVEDEPEALDERTNDELRELLAERDLPTYGNKDELVARLESE